MNTIEIVEISDKELEKYLLKKSRLNQVGESK
jgi:hypothetical protein